MNSTNDDYIKVDKFAKLTQKLNKLHSTSQNDTINPSNKSALLENKLFDLNQKYNGNNEILEKKYHTLREQINKLFKRIEEEKLNKENLKFQNNDELKNFELKIKNLLIRDQNILQTFADDLIIKIEEKISHFDKNFKNENEILQIHIKEIKENFEGQLNHINIRFDEDNEDRVLTTQKLVNEMNNELGKVHELV